MKTFDNSLDPHYQISQYVKKSSYPAVRGINPDRNGRGHMVGE
jgi:hypothetical protein